VSPTMGPGLVINEAEIDAGNDVTPTNNVISVTSSIRLPDLLVSKAGPAQVTFSETITYTISWGNQGEVAAGGVRITDTLPTWVEYVEDASGFTLTEPLSGVLVWEVTPELVSSGTQESFVLTGWVMVDPVMSGPLVNQVEIGSDTPEYDPSDDQDEWSTDLLLPDVGVQKTGAAWALYDSTITYTVVYSNSGDGLAAGVVITDILPIGVSYVRDDSGLDHTEPTSGTHVWQVGQVTAGHGDTFYVVVKLGSSSEVSAVVTNTVLIGADSPDADPTNDESEQTTRAVESLSRIYLPLVFKSYSQP
jgi:uncharacterized repeat protein (TIGR01451 family)